MSFFQELPELPPPPRASRNPSMGSSRAELPVGVPLSLLVARSERAAVTLGPIQVFSDGFEVAANLVVRVREEERLRVFDPFGRHHGQAAGQIVRLAFVFADGTSAEAVRAFDNEGGRTLVPQGGGGGEGRWSTTFWSWPLPPPGSVEVVCAWPAHGIAETRASFDAGPILEAAARVERLWPEPGGNGISVSSQMYFSSDG